MSASPALSLDLRDDPPTRGRFREEVWEGLSSDPPTLPCKYFYDERGSRLFEAICELDEYYLTRTEQAILDRYADEMAERIGPDAVLVEYGSGSSQKTRTLLDALPELSAYIPIDISRSHLLKAAAELQQRYAYLTVLPVCADYTDSIRLPAVEASGRTVVFFPGSTIGNMLPDEAEAFLGRARTIAGPDGGILVGADLQKEREVMEAAYNDAEGVTAAFNKNILAHINRTVGADFDLDAWRHHATFQSQEGRIASYLVSARDQEVEVDGRRFSFSRGSRIHTENSYKYTLEGFQELAGRAGLGIERVWTDEERWFSVQLLASAD